MLDTPVTSTVAEEQTEKPAEGITKTVSHGDTASHIETVSHGDLAASEEPIKEG